MRNVYRPVTTRIRSLSLVVLWLYAYSLLHSVSIGAEQEADELATIENRVKEVIGNVSPAVVKITDKLGNAHGWSGVIVTPDGYVATCAHHGSRPGEQVFVHLTDGRIAPARVCGLHEELDISVVKISDSDKFPCVRFGSCKAMKVDQLCLALGFPSLDPPSADRAPMIRMGRIANADAAPFAMICSCRVKQGDSGGGLFNLDGELIGVLSGSNAITRASSRYVGGELFQKYWNELIAAKQLKSPTEEEVAQGLLPLAHQQGTVELAPNRGLGPVEKTFHGLLQSTGSCVVEVLCDGEQKVLGTIVRKDGWVLTKASELFGDVSIRFKVGHAVPAELHGTLPEYDLALLKIPETDLPQIQWAKNGVPLTGTMLAAFGCSDSLGTVGIVSRACHHVPPAQGSIISSIQLLDSVHLPQVWKVGGGANFYAIPFHEGDVVKQIEGVPTPDFQSLIALTGGPNDGRYPGKVVGDQMIATVERDGRTIDLHFQLGGTVYPDMGDLYPSGRFTGFTCVFSTDIFVLPEMCGGPLVNRQGHVAGIAIARANNNVETYVIPADIAVAAVERLIQEKRHENLPLIPSGAPTLYRPAKVGAEAPELAVQLLNGQAFRLSEQRGKTVVLCFWMMHSELCRLELGNLRALYHDLIRDKENFTMISLYTDQEDSKPNFEAHIEKHKIDWPVAWIHSNSAASADFLTRHLQPCFIAVGPTGKILLRDHDLARFREALIRTAASKTSAD
jgi:serine protease Do